MTSKLPSAKTESVCESLYYLALAGVVALSLGCLSSEDVSSDDSSPRDAAGAGAERDSASVSDAGGTDAGVGGGSCLTTEELTRAQVEDGATLAANSCYRVNQVLNVRGGALVIEPGARLSFGQDGGLSIEDNGRLTAVGSAANPIVFTGVEAARGAWQGIRFYNSRSLANRLEHVVVEHAGGRPWNGADRSRAGIYLEGQGVEVSLAAVTLQGHRGAALVVDHKDAGFALAGSVIQDNERPLYLHPNQVSGLAADNTFAENDASAIVIMAGEAARTTNWTNFEVPYEIEGTVEFAGRHVLAPGVELRFRQNQGLEVSGEGRLLADATGGDPIVLRGTEETAGFWKGVHLRGTFSTENVLRHAVITNGGSNGWNGAPRSRANIYMAGTSQKSSLALGDVRISGSGGYGVSVESESVLSGCEELAWEANAAGNFYVPEDASLVCGGTLPE